jgi:hypothetical protein
MSQSFNGAILLASLALAGCKFAGPTGSNDSASLGPPGPLKAGSYEISRRYGDEADRTVDELEVMKEDPNNWAKHYLDALWLKMEPDLPGPSQLDSQVNCHHEDPIVSADGSFKTEGYCNETGTNRDTNYKVTGRIASEGFEITINRSGANVPAGQEKTVFTGHLKSLNHGFL